MAKPISGNGGKVAFDAADELNVRTWTITKTVNLLPHVTSDAPAPGVVQRESGNVDWTGSVTVYLSNGQDVGVSEGDAVNVELFTNQASGVGGKFQADARIGDISYNNDIEGDSLVEATIALAGNGAIDFTNNP